jgi:phosphatidate phosphatase APP1
VAVSHAQGQVFDPFGTAVPGVIITLADERGSTLQTTTDDQGRFRLAATQGNYSFKAKLPMFQTSQTQLNVSEDLAGLIHPRSLRVILGMNSLFCAWVTTSQKEFQQIISDNKKRSEETAQRNATQK